MFYVERNAFCYKVVITNDGVDIDLAVTEWQLHKNVNATLIRSLSLIAQTIVGPLLPEDREAILMAYFENRGYRVKALPPQLMVDASGRILVNY